MDMKDLRSLYDAAEAELQVRRTHPTQGFDQYDRLYRSHITEEKWPFASKIAVPIPFSALLKKDTRLIATDMTGRMVPQEDGGELGAMVATELIHAQWKDIDFNSDEPMLMRWFRMSQNARKYGASFGYVCWKTDGDFNGWDFQPWDPRNVLTLAGHTDTSEGVFFRDFPTVDSLYRANDKATEGPIYDPAVLARLEGGSGEDDPNGSVNRQIRGLDSTGTSGSVTGRYRRITKVMWRGKDRWVDFVPTRGGEDSKKGEKGDSEDEPFLILRDIPNPFKKQFVPVVKLNYYPIDDDQYGVSELESVRSMVKALWALVCNYMDSANIELFPILKGRPTSVNWSTVEYKARAQWLMQDPQTDLVRLEHSNSNLQKFTEIYKFLTGAIAEALGESTAEASGQNAFAQDKTATEVKDTALLRSARDNFNRLALHAAMSKMVWFAFEMDRQLLTESKVVRVAGREAIEYFIREGLDGHELSEEGYERIEEYMHDNMGVEFPMAYEALRELGELDKFAKPLHPDSATGADPLPKLKLDRGGRAGFLSVNKSDLSASMRYVPDAESTSMPDDHTDAQNLIGIFDQIVQPQVLQSLVQSGDAPRLKDLLVKIMEKSKVRDGDRYFGAGEGMADSSQVPGQPPVPGQDPSAQPGMPVPPQGQPPVPQQLPPVTDPNAAAVPAGIPGA